MFAETFTNKFENVASCVAVVSATAIFASLQLVPPSIPKNVCPAIDNILNHEGNKNGRVRRAREREERRDEYSRYNDEDTQAFYEI